MEYIILCFHYCGAESWSRLLFMNAGEQLSQQLFIIPHISEPPHSFLLILQGLFAWLGHAVKAHQRFLIADAVHRRVLKLEWVKYMVFFSPECQISSVGPKEESDRTTQIKNLTKLLCTQSGCTNSHRGHRGTYFESWDISISECK